MDNDEAIKLMERLTNNGQRRLGRPPAWIPKQQQKQRGRTTKPPGSPTPKRGTPQNPANADSALTVLVVDENHDLTHFLERLMAEAGWKLLTAESASSARKLLNSERPNAALVDYMMPDGNGVELGVKLRQNAPHIQVIVMTGAVLPPEEEAICEAHDFPVLRKPFLASEIMNEIRRRLTPGAEASPRRGFAPEPRGENPFVRDGVLLEILHCLRRIEAKLDLLIQGSPE